MDEGMQKTALKNLVERFILSLSLDTTPDSPEDSPSNNSFSKIKNELIQKHSIAVSKAFSSLLFENNYAEKISFNTIQQELAGIWKLVHGTTLSYTALPDAAVTQFLIRVAYEALKSHLKPNLPSPLDVIKLLIPGLKGIDTLYIPSEYDYALPGINIAKLNFNEQQSNPELIIIQFLKSHLIADSGEYIIPVWALNKLIIDNYREPINNVYYQYDQNYQATNPTLLTQTEFIRLGQHNQHTQLINEILIRLEGYETDTSNLLGQIILLCKSLYFNSVEGVGQEQKAGASAEIAIRKFFDYYNALDLKEVNQALSPELKEEFKKLRQCLGIYLPGERKIQSIETCLATRRAELLKAVQGQESTLAQINVNKASIECLIQKDQELLKQTIIKLNQFIKNHQLNGFEKLPLNKQLIDRYQINLKVRNFDALLELIKELSAEEIATILRSVSLNRTISLEVNWLMAIDNLENLVILFLEASIEKIEILCEKFENEFKYFFLKSIEDYVAVMMLLSSEKQHVLASHFINPQKLIESYSFENELLFFSINHPEIFSTLWNLLSAQQQVKILSEGNLFRILMINPIRKFPIIKNILESVPEEERFAAIISSMEGETFLHSLHHRPKLLKTILELFSENYRLKLFKAVGIDGTILHQLNNPKSLKIILELLPESQRLEVVTYNCYPGTVLEMAGTNPKKLKAILKLLPENHRIKAVQVLMQLPNQDSLTMLNYAMKEPDLLKIILESLPEKQRYPILQKLTLMNNTQHRSVIYHLFDQPKTLRYILELLPESQRVQWLKLKNEYGNTLLHAAANHPQILRLILGLFPPSQRFEIIKMRDLHGRTVIHQAAYNTESLRTIFELLPQGKHFEALRIQDKDGDSALHYAAHHQGSLDVLLKSIEQQERLEIVKIKNRATNSVVDCAIYNLQSLEKILTLLPENKRLQAVVMQNKEGDSLFNYAAHNFKWLKMILELLPESERLKAVITQDKDKNTVLHYAVTNHKKLKIILQSIPESSRLKAIKLKNDFNYTVLDLAVSHPKSFKAIKELLPEKSLTNNSQSFFRTSGHSSEIFKQTQCTLN